MNREPKVAVVTMEGTNNEFEAFNSLKYAGAAAEIVHIKKFESGARKVSEYDMIFFPGGFSAGDYIRAGAIMAARIKAKLLNDIESFVEQGNLVMGSCNGFQVLIELGLLPNTQGKWETEAALAVNISNRFEARTIYLRVRKNNCLFLKNFEDGEVIKLPIAHMEGRFVPKSQSILEEIVRRKMNVLTYVDSMGKEADYPWNPNGSVLKIAGLCNDRGNVLGLMPHPERVFFRETESDWTRGENRQGMGFRFFLSAVEAIKEKF